VKSSVDSKKALYPVNGEDMYSTRFDRRTKRYKRYREILDEIIEAMNVPESQLTVFGRHTAQAAASVTVLLEEAHTDLFKNEGIGADTYLKLMNGQRRCFVLLGLDPKFAGTPEVGLDEYIAGKTGFEEDEDEDDLDPIDAIAQQNHAIAQAEAFLAKHRKRERPRLRDTREGD
jgi:hypothetical protein